MTTPTAQMSWVTYGLTLNAHRFSGLADDDQPIELPDIETMITYRGRDGGAYFMDTMMRGGPLMLRLLPTSPSTMFLLECVNRLQLGALIAWNGEVHDRRFGRLELTNGVLTRYRPFITPGQNYEVTFEFENMVPKDLVEAGFGSVAAQAPDFDLSAHRG